MKADKVRARPQLNFETPWRTMLALEEGEEVLFTLQIMFCCWLPEEEGVRRVGIMVWMVRRDQVAPVVRGKIRHKFVMEVQMGSQVNAIARAPATMEE